MSEPNKNYILDNQFFISKENDRRHIAVCLQADAQGKVPEWIEVVREGNWSDFFKGDFQYTEEILNTFKFNFDNNVLRTGDGQIPFNYRHDIGGEAAGWIDKMELRNKVMQSGDTVKSLWMHVSWTMPATEAIADHRWKYASIEDLDVWTDPETQEITEHVLFGTGLTNIPFVAELEPAIRLNSTQYQKKEEDNMPDNTNEIKTLTAENTTLKLNNQTLEKTNKDLSDKLTKLTKEFEDFKGKIEADKADSVKDTEAIKMLEDGVRVSKKLNASILDDAKKTDEFKLAKENPEAFKMMLSKLPVLDVATPPAGHGDTPPAGSEDGKKELTSGEFRDKALKLTKEDPALKELKQHEAYSKAAEMLKEQGYSYTQ